MKVNEGLAWLEALAQQYETTARNIRETARLIRVAEQAGSTPARVINDVAPDALGAAEAIRKVMATKGVPMTAAQIWAGIRELGINLRTRSSNPQRMISPMLHSMQLAGQITKGPDKRWMMA